MSRNRLLAYYAAIVVAAGAGMCPLVSRAFFTEGAQKLREESADQREERREQFRQNVLEKRREMISKWHEKAQELKEKFFEGGQDISSVSEMRQSENTQTATSSMATTAAEQEEQEKENFFSAMKKRVNGIMHLLSRLGNLFGDNQ